VLSTNGRSQPGRILFLSGVPTSMGHVYRVEHVAAALAHVGWRTSWLPADDPRSVAEVEAAHVVTAFRAPWSEPLALVASRCRGRGIPFVYDVDDLIFEPDLMASGRVAVLEEMPPDDRRRFEAMAARHRETLAQADAAVLTTEPLAAAAAMHCRRTFVVPNALDPRMEAAASKARSTVSKPSATDGRPRLVFASGTPSHARDFTVAADAVARVFARHAEPLLVVVGHLDIGRYPSLDPFADRIERRPIVPLLDLFTEVARCDVNLAPLELGNPFCDSKSGIRCLVASIVGVPSIASPTPPQQEVIADGRTGVVAGDVAAWERALEQLVTDAPARLRMGRAAQAHAEAHWGFTAWAPHVERVYAQIAAGGG
jgi:glycosyltransferase involved in cell wall biosynthesis